MWEKMLDGVLRQMIQAGALELTMPSGTKRRYGSSDAAPIRVRLTDRSLPRRLVLSPQMAVGEGYMDGTLEIEGDNLYGFLVLAISNYTPQNLTWIQRPANALAYLKRRILSLIHI